MAPNTPIRSLTTGGSIGLSQPRAIESSNRIGAALRISTDSANSSAVQATLSKTIPGSATDRAVASSYTAKKREIGQAARNLERGQDILQVSINALEALKDITLQQLSFIDRVADSSLSTEVRQAISDQVSELASEFSSVTANTQFNTQQVFSESFSINTGSGQPFSFSVGDALVRTRIEPTGTRATAEGATPERTEFDFSAAGVSEQTTLTFSSAPTGEVSESTAVVFLDASNYLGGESFVIYDETDTAHTFQIAFDVGDPANGDVIISVGYTADQVATAARAAFAARGFQDFSVGDTAYATTQGGGNVTDAYSNDPNIGVSVFAQGSPADLTTDSTLIVADSINGGTHTFVFAVDGATPTLPGTVISINSYDSDEDIALAVETAVNAAAIGVSATRNLGQVMLTDSSKANVTDTQLNAGGSHTTATTVQGTPIVAGAYITFYSTSNNQYNVYFTVDGAGAAPAVGGTNIEVAVASTDSLSTILAAAVTEIESQTNDEFSASSTSTAITITGQPGSPDSGPPTAVGDTINVSILQAGSDSSVEVGGAIRITAHPFSDGDAVKVYSSGELPEGLEEDTIYYVIVGDPNVIALARTAADAAAYNNILFIDEGIGSLTLVEQNLAGATQSSEPLTFDLTDDVDTQAAQYEVELQLQRVQGELNRLNTLAGRAAESSEGLFRSAIEHGKRGAELSLRQSEKDAGRLSRDIPQKVTEALGAHSELDPYYVLKLLEDD